jgi:hypothetical protein
MRFLDSGGGSISIGHPYGTNGVGMTRHALTRRETDLLREAFCILQQLRPAYVLGQVFLDIGLVRAAARTDMTDRGTRRLHRQERERHRSDLGRLLTDLHPRIGRCD